MNDVLLQLSGNRHAKKLVSAMGLPVPQKLWRNREAWAERPLSGRAVFVGGAGALHPAIAEALVPAGAAVSVVEPIADAYEELGEAYSQPIARLDLAGDVPKAHGLLFDATNVTSPGQLRGLYDFFHPLARKVRKCGRVVVLGRPPEDLKDPTAAAAAHGLEGFVRSLAKEIGRKGATAHVIYVAKGAGLRLTGLLRFLLSAGSVYMTGQLFKVTKTVKLPDVIPFVRPLEGKVALVTGAARGIGAATAEVLAREGAHVVCLDRPEDDELLAGVARKVGGTMLLQDMGAADAATNIAAHFEQEHGGVDIVVHNAGITRDKTLVNMSEERWDQTIAVNLSSIVEVNERLLDGVLRSHGRIVCLSSIAGIAGNFGQTNYAASKSAIIGYVGALARKVGKKGISVNAVAPGFIETRLTAAIPLVTREVARRFCTLSQGGQPADVAEAIAFYASPGSAGLTGTVVRVCGGNLIGA